MFELVWRIFVPRPYQAVIAFAVYVVLIKFVAPKKFERKLPHRLCCIRFLYYNTQITLSLYLLLCLYFTGSLTFLSNYCNKRLLLDGNSTFWMSGILWVYYLSKWLNVFSTILLGLERRFNEIYVANLIYEGIAIQTAWVIYAFTKTSQIGLYIVADQITNVLIHATNIVTMKCPNVNRNIFLSLRFLHGSFLVIHSLENLVWNACNVPTDYVVMIPINTAAIFVTVFVTFRGYHKYKIAKKFDNDTTSVTTFDSSYSVSASTSSVFNINAGDPNDVKRRNVNKLQAQV